MQNLDSTKMTLEVISTDNIRALTDLVLELWTDSSFEEEFENYRNIIGTENEICYLAKNTDTYVAFVHAGIRNDYVEGANDLPIGYIEAIYVKPQFQQKGIAKVLMSAVEKWAVGKGLKQLASDTSITNLSGIDFHKKVGFTEVERIVCFIKDL